MRGQLGERLGEVEVVGELGARRSPCPRGRWRRAGRGSTCARAGRRSGRRPRRTARRGSRGRPRAPPRRRATFSVDVALRPSRSGRASGRPAARRPAARGRSPGRSSPWCAAWACTAGRCPPGGPWSRPRGSAPPARRRACPVSGSSRAPRPGAPPARAGSAAAPPACAAARRPGCRWPPCGSGRRTARWRRRRAGRRRRRPGRDGRRARRRCVAGSARAWAGRGVLRRGLLWLDCVPVTPPSWRAVRARSRPGGGGSGTGARRSCRASPQSLRSAGGWSRSQSAARRFEARASQASCTTSASSSRVSSPIRLPRSRTDRCPLKCGVVKNGDDSSWTSACLSSSAADPEHDHVGVALAGLGVDRVGRGLRKKTNDLPPTW